MITDQGAGAHHAQTQHVGGGIETWITGVAIAAATLVGTWSDVLECQSSNTLLEIGD